jgi:hypothetical protein
MLDRISLALRRPMQPRPDPRCRLILAHMEYTASRLDLRHGAPPATKALESVASAKYTDTASLSTPRIPDGVIAQPSEPQFSSSQAVI